MNLQHLQNYRPPSFNDKLNQRISPYPFDRYGLPKNTRYSPLNMMDVGFLGVAGKLGGFDYAELKAYWKFNEASGNILNVCDTTPSSDCLTSNDDMVVTGATYGATGKIGDALSFDGTDDKTEAANFVGLSAIQKFTINGWWKQDALDVKAGGFEIATADNGDSIGFTTWTDGIMYGYMENGLGLNANIDDYSLSVTAGTWFMYTMVFDGTLSGNTNRLKIFIDSVSETLTYSDTIPATTATHTSRPFRLGMQTTSTNEFWNGDIDEVSIWNRPLTQSEIDELYNSGSGLEL